MVLRLLSGLVSPEHRRVLLEQVRTSCFGLLDSGCC